MEIILGIILLFGGYELLNDDTEEVVEQVVVEVLAPSAVSDQPTLERGLYYQTSDGYYISDLSKDDAKVAGCDLKILTADLSHARRQEQPLSVSEAEVSCGR